MPEPESEPHNTESFEPAPEPPTRYERVLAHFALFEFVEQGIEYLRRFSEAIRLSDELHPTQVPAATVRRNDPRPHSSCSEKIKT